jgi:hypothetical protein
VNIQSERRNTAEGGSCESNTSLTIAGSEDGLQRGEFTQQKISEQKYHPKNLKAFLA